MEIGACLSVTIAEDLQCLGNSVKNVFIRIIVHKYAKYAQNLNIKKYAK
jgi:hypothetical protein